MHVLFAVRVDNATKQCDYALGVTSRYACEEPYEADSSSDGDDNRRTTLVILLYVLATIAARAAWLNMRAHRGVGLGTVGVGVVTLLMLIFMRQRSARRPYAPLY